MHFVNYKMQKSKTQQEHILLFLCFKTFGWIIWSCSDKQLLLSFHVIINEKHTTVGETCLTVKLLPLFVFFPPKTQSTNAQLLIEACSLFLSYFI